MPISDNGTVTAGIIVAQKLRRNAKITSTTSTTVKHKVSFTSVKLALIDNERSLTTMSFTDGGMPASSRGSIALIRSTSWSVFEPGWRQIPTISPI